ncbi:ARM repeat-containing protein [Hanseniaspora valbyensis NRRL Y-1626]|uniref:ARM repeat-containing protein n=1 Tax=Hanseniaspora valbyensis NRRL Y-1626 TaxID=766949 RepID=A0A1B7T7T5_9ASCO|nr:ARM repeat-containing protein [Hanseniaspora valbyensis NRRL Y-1626]
MSSNVYDPMFEQLLVNCQSADKLTRETSEKQLLAEAYTNTNTTFVKLLNTTISETSTNELKLFAILTIRKLITIYWSDTMPSFNGDKYIDDCNLKERIKQSLLNIAVTKENIDHRIINCARYVIVQIASCDFPECWPNMIHEILSKLHTGEENSLLNGLKLLTELFEDVLTDDMFFTNDIGILIFKTIVDYVSNFSDIKILEHVLKLYASCITILTTSQVFIDYEDMVVNQLTDLNSAIISKFNNSNIPIQLESFKLWKTYFELIQLLRINVSKSITKENKSILKSQILTHLQTATNIYLSDLDRYYDYIEFVDYVIVIISLLSMLLKNFNNETEFICDCLIKLNKLSNLKKEELLDVNGIVEDFFIFFNNMDEQNKKISKQYQKTLNDKILLELNSGIADEENCLSLLTNCIDKESNNSNILMIVNKLYENIINLIN